MQKLRPAKKHIALCAKIKFFPRCKTTEVDQLALCELCKPCLCGEELAWLSDVKYEASRLLCCAVLNCRSAFRRDQKEIKHTRKLLLLLSKLDNACFCAG